MTRSFGNSIDNDIAGLAGSDTLVGNGGADKLAGGTGNDNLRGGSGSDTLDGGSGDDDLIGDDGNDILSGGLGQDDLFGGDGNDTLAGGDGSDDLSGGAGIDTASYADARVNAGGLGVTAILLNASLNLGEAQGDSYSLIENLEGSAFVDVLAGSNAANTIFGRAGNDVLLGQGGNDTLFGDDGNDTLNGQSGADTMNGGKGDDIYFVDSTSDAANETSEFFSGNDRVQTNLSYTLKAGSAIEQFKTTEDSGTTAISLTGNELTQIITGNAGANIITGGGGRDTMIGLRGNDTYIVSQSNVVIVEQIGGGTDRVQSAASYRLAANVENLTLLGTDTISGTGNDLANTITGNSVGNVLNGSAGNDVLTGGAGKDAFLFSTALNATSNVDRITDLKAVDDGFLLDNAIFTAFSELPFFSTIGADAFFTGAAAHDASDRIVYNNVTGALTYDPDGTVTSGDAIRFATLGTGLLLTEADFLVV